MDTNYMIETIMDVTGYRSTSLAKELGVNVQQIGDCKRGKVKKINPLLVNAILQRFPQFNREWLLTGDGNPVNINDEITDANTGKTPYYNVDFSCGYDIVANCQQVSPDGFVSLPFLKDADCLINASGRSMYPIISEGDIIAIKQVHKIDNILYGEIYAIVTDDYRTIKRVRKSDKDGYIRLVPENKDYDEQDVCKSEIKAVFKILRAIKNID